MRESSAVQARRSIPCYHGGEFFKAIGETFEDVSRRRGMVNADVLDAWFPPAPSVIAALEADLEWLLRTSPPTNCEGLLRTIAEVRGVPVECIVPGAGSSDLIFRAFSQWLDPDSRVLLLDPTYGEYSHVCTRVLGCTVERVPIRREESYQLDLELLQSRLKLGGYDLAVIVNPNNPTGQYVGREELMSVLQAMPPTTMAWIDEAYLDYVPGGESLEAFATMRPNVVVCKSMSKAFGLSGMRAAYLIGSSEVIEQMRAWTPPWVIGLPAQVAAVMALGEPQYYQKRYRETAELRQRFADRLRRLKNWDVVESNANFVLCDLPKHGPTAAAIAALCQASNVFVRDVSNMGTALQHSLRIAVKTVEEQDLILAAL